MEQKRCKNKNCGKVLPEGYKYSLCEHCRNQRVDKTKNVLKGIGVGIGTVAGVAVTVLTLGKIKPKG